MKNIILFLNLFFTVIVTSQSLEKIKQQNTFFILFDNDDKLTQYGCDPENLISSCGYRFFLKKGKLFEYSFYYHKYKSIEEAHSKINEVPLFRIHKSFLRKNKDIILTREFMEKMGSTKIISLLDDDASNKTIFLINTADTKNGTILLREVTIDYTKDE